MDTLAQLTPQLKHLRLSGLLDSLDLRNRQAVEERLSYVEFLSRLLDAEGGSRAAQSKATLSACAPRCLSRRQDVGEF